MDPINILISFNIVATFGANFSGAKKGLRTSMSNFRERPKTYLQAVPVTLATICLLFLILGVFKVGVLDYSEKYQAFRLVSAVVYIIFSWLQVWAYKTLGPNYAQDIVILKKHELVTKGPYRLIRHPHYLAQILVDIGAACAVMSYLVLPFAIIEIPLFILRAVEEDKLLLKNFGQSFETYKKKSGFMIPFIG